jgi:hypothetical protein
MKVERNKDEVIFRISADINIEDLQNLSDLIEFKEISNKSKAKQEDIDDLVKIIKKGRWKKIQNKLDL